MEDTYIETFFKTFEIEPRLEDAEGFYIKGGVYVTQLMTRLRLKGIKFELSQHPYISDRVTVKYQELVYPNINATIREKIEEVLASKYTLAMFILDGVWSLVIQLDCKINEIAPTICSDQATKEEALLDICCKAKDDIKDEIQALFRTEKP